MASVAQGIVGKRIRGPARVDRRTKNLVLRLHAGEIAIIDHRDLDGPCAQALIERGAAAVVNADRSISGRFPTLGPWRLLQAGIPILDNLGPQLLKQVREGAVVELVGDTLYSEGTLVGQGELLNREIVTERLVTAKQNLGRELERFVQNTLSFVANEQHLLWDLADVPELDTSFEGRHVLVVVRGESARQDLRTIRSYVKGVRPVLVGVDGGADLLLEEGYRPSLIIGDMDSVSDAALTCGAELVVHAYTDHRAPGQPRLERLGLKAKPFAAVGTSEDVALLLAYEKGADLITAVGTHSSLIDFLEKAREGMSSTFLVRLKVGSILVDARGVSKLYPAPLPVTYLLALVAVAVLLGSILAAAPEVRWALAVWIMRLRSLWPH